LHGVAVEDTAAARGVIPDLQPVCIREFCTSVGEQDVGVFVEQSTSKGLIQEIQADEVNAGGSADIHLHPSGQYLYTSHRLDNDGISIFKTNADGTLEKTGYVRTGRHPRNFLITPDGKLLLAACMNDHLVQVFRIEDDGTLALTPSALRFENDRPSSLTL
jgi:6-phosphogluconolactonase (cycloisomerase 2 family)